MSLLEDDRDFFHSDNKRLKDNILLLIDEADLYLHPAWQQKWMNELIRSLDQLFPSNNVQIVFTTHSPIMLSDIPKGNIIFLTSDNNRLIVDNPENHKESFGASIYKLYNDAFFLEETGQIGAFAHARIRSLIQELNDAGDTIFTDDEYRHYEQVINKIGEPLIREPLYRMLYKHSKMNTSISLRDQEISYHEERIRRLKGGQ